MRRIFLYVPLILFTSLGCSPSTKIIKFPKQPNEVFANENLKNFFKANKTPNIVLRVPNNNDKATSNTSTSKDNNVLYNAIEKELLKEGFSVRDRGLFNELLSKSQMSDYSNIKELTNTDVILEVVNINPAVVYSTNKVTIVGKKKETEKIGTVDYKTYGASVEYRLILVKNNEIAGTYKYNYQPCATGCETGTFTFTGKNALKKIELKETVAINALEQFITLCTKDLIKSFRANQPAGD